ncbi:CASTOR/POLLUX-related putative ion channel [Streptomyces sp. NPDC002309]
MRDRARYLFDRTLARSTGTLLSWLAACCLAVVLPVSALMVWTDPAAPRSLAGRLTAVWRTSAETLRLGGVTGGPLRMLLAGLLGLIALLCVSTLIGVITTGLGDRLEELRRGRSTVLEEDHAVVLGWSDQVFTVVAETVAAVAARPRGVVAVLAEHDTAEMETALTAVLGGGVGRARLVCRSGSPADPRALALVAPAAARSVLVLPSDETGDGADVEVVRVLLALRVLLGARTGPPVVAAVRDGRFLPAARLAAGSRGTVLETDVTTARLLAQSARRPGLSAALRDLLDFSGAEFHLVDAPELTGRCYADIALLFEASCVVGFLRADGRAALTPAGDTVLAAGDRLVVVARDERTDPPVDCRDHVDTSVMTARLPGPPAPTRVLLLGWNRRAPLLLDILRETSVPGALVDVVMDQDRRPASDGAGDRADAECHANGPATERPRVRLHTADLARPEFLDVLDVFEYDSVVVLGPDEDPGTERPDDRTLLTLLFLHAREEEAGRALPVVAEFRDPRSRALAPLGPASDAVVRGELTALVMAQISHSPELAAVFDEVFAARAGALALRPAGHYVRPGAEAAFATVVAAALERGECALGYRVPAQGGTSSDVLRLSPGKSWRRVWDDRDEILVLTSGTATTDATERGGGALPGMRGEAAVPPRTGTQGPAAAESAPREP